MNQYPGKDITVSLFREACPRELFAALREEGRSIEEKFPGIYYVTGDIMFDTQIVVTGRLAADSHNPLRILSGRAGREDVRKAVRLNTEQVTERVTEQKDREMAVKLFGRGMSMDTIAELIGCSADVILQWVSPVSQT